MIKDEALLMAIEFMGTLTIDVGIKTWNEKHRKEAIQACEKALEQPQSDDYTEGYQQGWDEGWEAKKAEQQAQEPFGYFTALPFGWINCKEDDEGAIALYEHPAPSCDKVSRFEVIDNNGRSYVNCGVDKMEFSYQDDGKTLKIFTNGSGTAPSWQGLSDDEIARLILINEVDKTGDVGFYNLIEQALKEKNT